jgi:hypothetical protein
MSKETRTEVIVTCDLCKSRCPKKDSDYTEIRVSRHDEHPISHDPEIITAHVCSKCSSALLQAWNAYCR